MINWLNDHPVQFFINCTAVLAFLEVILAHIRLDKSENRPPVVGTLATRYCVECDAYNGEPHKPTCSYSATYKLKYKT